LRNVFRAALCICLLASTVAQAAQRKPVMGVWIRLDEMAGKGPQEICDVLLNYSVGAVFMLVPLPPTQEEMDTLKGLRSRLPPEVEVHAWLAVYSNARYLESDPQEEFQSTNGSVIKGWVNPTSTSYRIQLVEWVQQIAAELEPNGIFLDYFYVPFGPFDNETLRGFSSSISINVSASTLTSSEYLLSKFLEWRNGKILETLKAIKRVTDARGLRLSVFIRMVEESERLASGQDVGRLAELADFLVPNSYHRLVGRDAGWVGVCVQALKAEGAKGVWAGIQGYDITPLEVNRAVASAVEFGADGVVLFRFGTMTPQHWEQARLGLSRRPNLYTWAIPIAGLIAAAGIGFYFLTRRKRKAAGARREKEKKRKPARRR